MEIQKLPQVNESVSSAFTQFQNVQPLVYDNALSPYETISKLLWWVKSLTSTINQIIDELDKHEQEYAALKEQVNGINTRLTTAEQEINNAKERLDGHDDEIAEINADLQEIHQTITSIQNDITTLQGRCTEIENRLDGHDTEIQNLKDKDTDLQSQITSNDEDITKLQEKDTDLENQIHSNDTDISNLQQKDTELQTQITANKKSIDTINTQIIEINGNIDTINSNIDNLQAQITSNDSDITALQGETKQLKTDLTNLSTHVDEVEAELQRQITDNDTDISDLQSRMKIVETDVATLKTNVSNLQLEQRLMGDNITVIQNTINTINNNIESINDNIDTINNTLTTIQSNVEQNRQDIVDLTGKVTTNTNEISDIKEQIAGLDVAAVKQEIADIQSDITDLQSGQADLLKQIQSNDTDIDNLKSADTALQNSITTINQRIETVENSIATLETQGNQNTTDIEELKKEVAELKKGIPYFLHSKGAGVFCTIKPSTTGNKAQYIVHSTGGTHRGVEVIKIYNPPTSEIPRRIFITSGIVAEDYIKYKVDGNNILFYANYDMDYLFIGGDTIELHTPSLPAVAEEFSELETDYIKNIDLGTHFSHEFNQTKYQNVIKIPFNINKKFFEFDVNSGVGVIAKYRVYMQSSSGEIGAYLTSYGSPSHSINNHVFVARPAGTNQPYYIAFDDNFGCDVFVEANDVEVIAELEDTSILENATHPVVHKINNIDTTAIDTKIQTIETEQESLESRVEAAENSINDLTASEYGYQHCFVNVLNKIPASTSPSIAANQVMVFKNAMNKIRALQSQSNNQLFVLKFEVVEMTTLITAGILTFYCNMSAQLDIPQIKSTLILYHDPQDDITGVTNLTYKATKNSDDLLLSIGSSDTTSGIKHQYSLYLVNPSACQVTERELFIGTDVPSSDIVKKYITYDDIIAE